MLVSPAIDCTPQERRLGLVAVIASSFFIGASFGMGYPVASFKLTAAGEPGWIVGLIGAVPSMAVFLMLPFLPKLVRRFGAAATLVTGGLTAAAGYVALTLADSTIAWLVLRFVMGASIALSWLVSQTWVSVASDEATRGRVLALYVMAFSSGMAVCPVILDKIGVSGAAPLIYGALASVAAIIPILLVSRLAPDVDKQDARAGSVIDALWWAPVAMAGAFLSGFIELIHLSLLPNAGIASGLDQSAILFLLTLFLVGALTLQFAFGWLSDKLPAVPLAIAVCLVLALVCLLLPASLPHPILGAITIYAIGGLIYGLYTVALAVIGELKHQPDSGAVNAAFIMSYQVGGIAGPVIAGVAMNTSPIAGFVATQVIVCILVALVMYGAMRAQRKSAQ